MFLKAGTGTVCFIAALAENNYQLDSEQTDNPFFQGNVTFTGNFQKSGMRCQEDKVYINATSYYSVNSIFDRKGKLLLAYSIDENAPKSLRKNGFMKCIINQGMSRRSGGSVSDVEDLYIDMSAVCKKFFGKRISYSLDEDKKILLLKL